MAKDSFRPKQIRPRGHGRGAAFDFQRWYVGMPGACRRLQDGCEETRELWAVPFSVIDQQVERFLVNQWTGPRTLLGVAVSAAESPLSDAGLRALSSTLAQALAALADTGNLAGARPLLHSPRIAKGPVSLQASAVAVDQLLQTWQSATMERKAKSSFLDLSKLSNAEEGRKLAELVEHADLDSAALQAIRTAANRRLGGVPSPESTSSAELQAQVFGDQQPSLAGFRAYLKGLQRGGETTYEQKKFIVRTVNYWKARLGLEFLFQGEICRLTVKSPSRGHGGFILRRPGADVSNLYAAKEFPAFSVRRTPRGTGPTA